jgi:hypothetical protein
MYLIKMNNNTDTQRFVNNDICDPYPGSVGCVIYHNKSLSSEPGDVTPFRQRRAVGVSLPDKELLFPSHPYAQQSTAPYSCPEPLPSYRF